MWCACCYPRSATGDCMPPAKLRLSMIAENAGGRIATASEVHIFDRQKRVGKPHRMRDFRKPCFAPANAIEGGMS
jgi:hypothetical protein